MTNEVRADGWIMRMIRHGDTLIFWVGRDVDAVNAAETEEQVLLKQVTLETVVDGMGTGQALMVVPYATEAVTLEFALHPVAPGGTIKP